MTSGLGGAEDKDESGDPGTGTAGLPSSACAGSGPEPPPTCGGPCMKSSSSDNSESESATGTCAEAGLAGSGALVGVDLSPSCTLGFTSPFVAAAKFCAAGAALSWLPCGIGA